MISGDRKSYRPMFLELEMTIDKYQIYNEPTNNIEEHLLFVAQFVTDPKMDPIQDLDFFIELVFESKYGHINTRFCRYFLVKRENYTFSFEAIGNFLEFLNANSSLFTNDFFHTLCIDYSLDVIEKVFNILSAHLKHQAIEVFVKYNKVINEIPRIKTFMIFS
jgi:hypothetical protein